MEKDIVAEEKGVQEWNKVHICRHCLVLTSFGREADKKCIASRGHDKVEINLLVSIKTLIKLEQRMIEMYFLIKGQPLRFDCVSFCSKLTHFQLCRLLYPNSWLGVYLKNKLLWEYDQGHFNFLRVAGNFYKISRKELILRIAYANENHIEKPTAEIELESIGDDNNKKEKKKRENNNKKKKESETESEDKDESGDEDSSGESSNNTSEKKEIKQETEKIILKDEFKKEEKKKKKAKKVETSSESESESESKSESVSKTDTKSKVDSNYSSSDESDDDNDNNDHNDDSSDDSFD